MLAYTNTANAALVRSINSNITNIVCKILPFTDKSAENHGNIKEEYCDYKDIRKMTESKQMKCEVFFISFSNSMFFFYLMVYILVAFLINRLSRRH